MRGEQAERSAQVFQILGSPPHARGAVNDPVQIHVVERITPACAGSSQITNALVTLGKDHPRMRGEQSTVIRTIIRGGRSPPHARGAVRCGITYWGSFGITPACAGSSNVALTDSAEIWDHPRMRGEQSGWRKSSEAAKGSPPHTRGAVFTSMLL